MKRRAFSLSNKSSMLCSDMMYLKQKQKYNSTTNDITRKTLGAKLQQEGLHFGLAKEEEHPWLGGQLYGPRSLQPFPLRHPLISQRVFSLCPCLCPSPPRLPILGRWLGQTPLQFQLTGQHPGQPQVTRKILGHQQGPPESLEGSRCFQAASKQSLQRHPQH